MKQGSNSRRSRGRGNGKRPQKNHNFDSNGPEGRVRGNAQQVYEKYIGLARDAMSAGDRIATENYFQHAEHYLRVLMAQDNGEGRVEAMRRRNQFELGMDEFDEAGGDDDDNAAPESARSAPREDGAEPPREAGGNGGRKVPIERSDERAANERAANERPERAADKSASGASDDSPDDEGLRRTLAL